MATGSPTSTLLRNLMPLVVRPSRTSRQGMILLLSIGAVPGQKIFQDFQPKTAAFFRVKLGSHQRAPSQDAGKGERVLGNPQNHGLLCRLRIVTVDKVIFGLLRQPLKHRMRLKEADAVPAHVGNLQPWL